jgi:hypothetical protein
MSSAEKTTSITAHIPDLEVPDHWLVPGWQVDELMEDFQWMERQKNKIIEVMHDT